MPKPNMNCGDHYIDFRSDTVTLPTDEMLDAMRNAKVAMMFMKMIYYKGAGRNCCS